MVKTDVISAILSAQDAIADADMYDATEVVDPAPAATKTVVVNAPKRVKLIVHNQEGVDASKFVKVQVNGTMHTLPREVEIEVLPEVAEALKNAVITRFERENGELVEKPARRFPFSIVG